MDLNGVEWRAEASDRLFSSQNTAFVKEITLRRPFLDETLYFSLPSDIENSISNTEFGGEILVSINEISFLLKKGLAHSALTLSSYIIEGLIRARAKKMGIYKAEYDELTFGQLINEGEIKKIIPIGLFDEMKALNHLRKPSAHFKGVSPIVEEARIGAKIVQILAQEWFKPEGPRNSSISNL